MHFQILIGNDRFANVIQFLTMIGSFTGISMIAMQLGANRKEQILTVLVAATIPMGILQASTTQNDYVVTFWLICLVYYLMLLNKRLRITYTLAAGSSLGLALLTKATAYLYAFPFLLYFALRNLKTHKFRSITHSCFLIALAVILNLGYYIRNLQLFGYPFGDPHIVDICRNQLMNAQSLTSNLIRNIAIHVALPSKFVNTATYNVIKIIHANLGININDPATTFSTTKFHIYFSLHEDFSGNLIHLILLMLCSIFFFARVKQWKKTDMVSYYAAVSGGFLLFCLYLKWQPWHSRLHLPLFVLLSPFIAMVLWRSFNPIENARLSSIRRNSIFFFSIVFFLMFTCPPWLFYNWPKKLVGPGNIFTTSRIEQYFSNRWDVKDSYVGAIDFLKTKRCSDIGIVLLGEDDFEYPFVVLIQNQVSDSFRLEHVNVNNISSKYSDVPPFDNFNPCAILCVNGEGDNRLLFKGHRYVKEWSSGSVTVFARP
ncbi:MAG: glycosyltransferase family 39 protein [Methanocellales archaeon]|nr:glycosyltransferase family 39 protein [Methanocellales archaeon]